MKKKICIVLLFGLCFYPQAQAQIPVVSLITGIIKKVIIALDLKVQQLQNKVIALQNAEQQLENKLSLGHLNDINGWLDKEKGLYQSYYDDLAKVKTIIADYNQVNRIISQQARLVSEYQNAYKLTRQDTHFSAEELRYMSGIYSGILDESVRNLDEVLTAVNAVGTRMSDAERLEMVSRATNGMQKNLNDLRQFNAGNTRLSLMRSKDEADRQAVKQLYHLN